MLFGDNSRHADADAMVGAWRTSLSSPGLDERSALGLLFQQSEIKETETNVEEERTHCWQT
jgi:hypothetical protein